MRRGWTRSKPWRAIEACPGLSLERSGLYAKPSFIANALAFENVNSETEFASLSRQARVSTLTSTLMCLLHGLHEIGGLPLVTGSPP
ncbi:hypothetical protein EMIT048CA2_340012 [Pseudomonas chlororaphis]